MADPSTLSDDSLWCRTERHLWLWERDVVLKGEFERHSTCDRCGATRIKVVSMSTWQARTRGRKYPPGYLLPKGSGRVAAADVYRVQYERASRATRAGRPVRL